MLKFTIHKTDPNSKARITTIETAHSKIETPVFMPCATSGAVKGISPQELEAIGFKIILGNTYHLYLRPDHMLIEKMGGIQKFINWPNSILTDSGGFQVFSLGKNFEDYDPARNSDRKIQVKKGESLVQVTKRGVWFRSHLDGSKHLFTPEKVIDIQRSLGTDIMMLLDECTEFPATEERARKSMETTHRWAKEAVDYVESLKMASRGNFQKKIIKAKSEKQDKNILEQSVFGIVQGSTFKNLREESVKFISSLPVDGVAVGGVSVGEGKQYMYDVMDWVAPYLPSDKPHYLMGIGEPEDIIEGVKRGFDMFDCVLPTRLGRHGTIWTTVDWLKFEKIDLRKAKFREDSKILMEGCQCPACSAGFTRSYISHLIRSKEMLGMRLLSLHNLWLLNELTLKLREQIKNS